MEFGAVEEYGGCLQLSILCSLRVILTRFQIDSVSFFTCVCLAINFYQFLVSEFEQATAMKTAFIKWPHNSTIVF